MEKQPVDKKEPQADKSTNVKIVQLSPDDWKELRYLKHKSLMQEPIAFEDFESGKKKYIERTELQWREKLDEKASFNLTFLAEDNGNYVGMISALLVANEHKAVVQHMYVDAEDHRGQGIGRSLLVYLMDELKCRDGIHEVELVVVEGQIAARNLYENLGFRETGRVKAKRGDNMVTEIEMKLSLRTN